MIKFAYDRKNFLFQMSLLLVMKASTIQSTCKSEIDFSQPIVCILRCTSNYIFVEGAYTQAQHMGQIEYGYGELGLCHDEGIKLELRNYDSPSFVVRANSFTANIKVNYLQYSLIAISEMEANSLNATAFKSVTKLVFTNTSIDTFKNGLFNGLESVEVIHFKDVSDANLTIETGILDVVNRTLTEFTFEQLTRTSNEVVIDGFTGSTVLRQLTTVKFMYNLKNSITNKSFVGLEKVKALDLSNCQIETFGVGAFDAISDSVETLTLGNNFIKTLPAGLFDIMLPSHYTNIILAGNEKWICDCDLMPFKVALMEHSSNFIGNVVCDSPLPYKSSQVNETNFCEPTTTTEVTTESTTEVITTTPLPHEFPQECFHPDKTASEIVTIQRPGQIFSIIQNASVGLGDIVFQIDVPMENRILIWFSPDDTVTTNASEISCVTASNSSIRVTNLTENSQAPHTFCLMYSTDETISPFDCISVAIRNNHHKKPWLNESRKGLVVGMIAVVCSLCIVVGLAVGHYGIKKSIFIIQENEKLFVCTSDINAASQKVFDSNDSAPPLPPRPNSIATIKEYTYATVQ